MSYKAKLKAKLFMEQFRDENYFTEELCKENSKHNAKILVNEMIREYKSWNSDSERLKFWEQVKEELNSL